MDKSRDCQIPLLSSLTANLSVNPAGSEKVNYSMFVKGVRKHIPAFCLPEKKEGAYRLWEAEGSLISFVSSSIGLGLISYSTYLM